VNNNEINLPAIAGIVNPRIPQYLDTDIIILSGDPLKSGIGIGTGAGSKLFFFHEPNPFLENISRSPKKPDEIGWLADESVISIPGTIHYPDSLAEYGISVSDILPAVEGSGTQGLNIVQPVLDNSSFPLSNTKLLVVQNAIKLVSHPRQLARRILTLDHRAHPDTVLYLPGVANSNNLAVLAYLGIDIFDTFQCISQARLGNLMTSSGLIPFSSLQDQDGIFLDESCTELANSGKIFESILKHNQLAIRFELALVKSAISTGKLRELVEQRMLTDPELSALVHELDLGYYSSLEPYFPIFSPGRFITCSREGLNRVEVYRFRNRVQTLYNKPKSGKILVLIPCSAKKPYSTSKSHKQFKQALSETTRFSHHEGLLHEVIITSPLGLVPRELELVYPAQQYDIPVTGHWYEDELAMISDCVQNYLTKNNYEHILIHFHGQMGEFLEQCISEFLAGSTNSSTTCEIYRTSPGHPTSKESLKELIGTLKKILEKYPQTKYSLQARHRDTLESIARYQFGTLGSELVKNCSFKGRYPNIKIFKNKIQLGMLTGDRGFISLTLDGARELAAHEGFDYQIKIDDFVPKGSIMAVGVLDGGGCIRPGDDVVACFGDDREVRAVGSAVMSGSEMIGSHRGVAVKVRHHV
jgi:archaeosine synthase